MNKTRKFLAIRDKSTSSHNKRSKSVEPGGKSRTSTDGFLSIFKSDTSKQTAKEGRVREKEAFKAEGILNRLGTLNIAGITADDIYDALSSNYSEGDEEKAIEYLLIENDSRKGTVKPYDSNVQLVGAVNRDGVTCYLDSLIFAMFARLDAFDGMLKSEFPDDPKRTKLAAVLRLYVNMLRTGKLIHVDLVKLLQDSIADCGWQEAGRPAQQDTCEAFAVITEMLQLPLLPLQMDLYHNGIQKTEDHKVVYERLLILSIPEDLDKKGVTLEDCLEEYFNAKVDVTRDIEEKVRAKSLDSDVRSMMSGKSTIRVVKEIGDFGSTHDVFMASPLSMSPIEKTTSLTLESVLALPSPSPSTGLGQSSLQMTPSRPSVSSRHRSTSVIQNIVLDEEGRPSRTASEEPNSPCKTIPTGSSVAKASMIPAWQFWRFIRPAAFPRSATEPSSDAEMAMSLDKRPVVGICLRRYAMTNAGKLERYDTFVDIPESLRLPIFMTSDPSNDDIDANALATEYKLVLQSVVCHRGDSISNGHYVAFARVAPKLLTDNRIHSHDPPPDYEEAQWVRHDDLRTDNRVQYVEDIREALKDEMPYLLFYRIVPVQDMTSMDQTGSAQLPPSYENLSGLTTNPPTPVAAERIRFADGTENHQTHHPASVGDYFPATDVMGGVALNPPGSRISSELTRLFAPASDVGAVDYSTNPSRRGSVTFGMESNGAASTNETPSPVATPTEETTAQRLSRAAARLARTSRSRPSSQAGEGRISMTARLLMRAGKEPVACEGPNGSQGAAGAAATDTVLGTTPEHAVDDDLEARQRATSQGHKRPRLRDRSRIKASLPERQCSVM